MLTERNLMVALQTVFASPNELDRNFEAVNVVDGLFAIARAVDRLAIALEGKKLNDLD